VKLKIQFIWKLSCFIRYVY